MSLDPDLITRILDLPPDDRADLARRLLLSLEPSNFDADAERLWATEIERRSQSIRRGEVQLRDWRASVDRIRQSLGFPR